PYLTLAGSIVIRAADQVGGAQLLPGSISDLEPLSRGNNKFPRFLFLQKTRVEAPASQVNSARKIPTDLIHRLLSAQQSPQHPHQFGRRMNPQMEDQCAPFLGLVLAVGTVQGRVPRVFHLGENSRRSKRPLLLLWSPFSRAWKGEKAIQDDAGEDEAQETGQ